MASNTLSPDVDANIIKLRNRVSTTTDVAEKQKSLQDLLSIAPKAKKAVAEHFFAAGFLLLQGVDRSDEDTVETICSIFLECVEVNTPSDEDPCRAAREIIAKGGHTTCVLDLLNETNWRIRLSCIKILASLAQRHRGDLINCIIQHQGLNKLIDMLADERPIITNEVLILLVSITDTPPASSASSVSAAVEDPSVTIKRFLAFSNCFEALIQIISAESCATMVANDACSVLVNLLQLNTQNQNLFRENGNIQRLAACLSSKDPSSPEHVAAAAYVASIAAVLLQPAGELDSASFKQSQGAVAAHLAPLLFDALSLADLSLQKRQKARELKSAIVAAGGATSADGSDDDAVDSHLTPAACVTILDVFALVVAKNDANRDRVSQRRVNSSSSTSGNRRQQSSPKISPKTPVRSHLETVFAVALGPDCGGATQPDAVRAAALRALRSFYCQNNSGQQRLVSTTLQVPDEMLMDDEFAPGRVVVASILAAANSLGNSGSSSSAGKLLRIASTILSFGFIENSVCAELASGMPLAVPTDASAPPPPKLIARMSDILRQTMLGLSASPPTSWTSPWLAFSLLKLFVVWIHSHAAACSIIVDVPANLLQLVALFEATMGGTGSGSIAGDEGVCVRGMAAVLFAAVLLSTNKETIVFDLLVKRVGLENFAKAQDSLLTHAAFLAGEHRVISSGKTVQAEADAGMQLFDPDSCAIVRALLGKVQSKIYSAALATPSPPSTGNFGGVSSSATGISEAAAAAEAREQEVRAELERERSVVECLRIAAAAAARELQTLREQAVKDGEDLKTMLANESLLSRALDEKKRECAQMSDELKRLSSAVSTSKSQDAGGPAENDGVVAGLKEELAAARVGEANAVREQLAATAAAASAEEARAQAAESLMSLKSEHEDLLELVGQISDNDAKLAPVLVELQAAATALRSSASPPPFTTVDTEDCDTAHAKVIVEEVVQYLKGLAAAP